MQLTIQPWLPVINSSKAIEFYKEAFDAIETYRLDIPDGSVIARLSVNGSEFWVAEASSQPGNISPQSSGATARMILVVPDPDYFFNKAIGAGARQVFPVGHGHGWKLGRIEDPFGHHWEIGHPLEDH